MNLDIQNFNDLVKNKKLNPDFLKSKIKLAILSDTSSQFITKAIFSTGILQGFEYEIYESDYNQIDQNIYDLNSELYLFKPEFILIMYSTEKLLHNYYTNTDQNVFGKNKIEQIENLIFTLNKNINSKIILNTFFELNDSVYGNFASKNFASFKNQIKLINYNLYQISQKISNLYLVDIENIIGQFGYINSFDSKMYISYDLNYSLNFIPILAKNIHDIIKTLKGYFIKCIVLDLDNTLWGGIIGDDGLEGIKIGDFGVGRAFTNFQSWLKALKNRGIILCVCSKNSEDIAREPFLKHPEMVLKIEDIAIFIANWDTKVDNILFIQKVLNISFDSIVFIDDNAFEREMVSTAIPSIIIPNLPAEPENYVSYLRSLNLFETSSTSENDIIRTEQYQQESKRAIIKKSYSDENSFLKSLEMRCTFQNFDKFTIPRISQLSQRSNQFNLRTIRYTINELEEIVNNNNKYVTFSLSLNDKFGDYGLISYLILEILDDKTLFINSWVMSCRVLKRGVEMFIMNNILSFATKHSFKKIVGEYIPTSKNFIVSDLYKKLGFSYKSEGKWEFDISLPNSFSQHYITLNN
jgi:FkbH-like protein